MSSFLWYGERAEFVGSDADPTGDLCCWSFSGSSCDSRDPSPRQTSSSAAMDRSLGPYRVLPRRGGSLPGATWSKQSLGWLCCRAVRGQHDSPGDFMLAARGVGKDGAARRGFRVCRDGRASRCVRREHDGSQLASWADRVDSHHRGKPYDPAFACQAGAGQPSPVRLVLDLHRSGAQVWRRGRNRPPRQGPSR